jgi:hypothetical protein
LKNQTNPKINRSPAFYFPARPNYKATSAGLALAAFRTKLIGDFRRKLNPGLVHSGCNNFIIHLKANCYERLREF